MKYLLLLHNDENAWESISETERTETIGAYMAYAEALKKAGAHYAGEPLEHSRATKRVTTASVQDGPFADGKEQLAGFFLIEAANLDEALDWAAKCPCASHGAVEVRPLWNIDG